MRLDYIPGGIVFKTTKPDSRILILQIIIISILSFSLGNWTALILLFLIVDLTACCFFGARTGIKYLAVYGITYGIQRFLSLIFIPLLSQVLAMFLILFLKAIPVYIAVLLLMRHSPMNELLASLRKLHVPMLFLIPFSVMYRYLPTIRQECKYIHESLLMRGLHSSKKMLLRHPMRSAEHYLVPLLFRSEQITEELSAATLCKGLRIDRERTCYVEVRLQAADYLYLFGLLLVSAALLYVNSHIYFR